MLKRDIIDTLDKQILYCPNSAFYNDCKIEIEKYENDIIKEIPFNKYFIESVRIHILNNKNYNIYICSEEIEGCSVLQIEMSKPVKQIYFRQLACIDKYNSILSLEDRQDPFYIKDIHVKNIHINITTKKISEERIYNLNNCYEIVTYIFGMETYNMINYQRLDKIIRFIKRFKNEENNGYKLLEDINVQIKKYGTKLRDQFIIINNAFYNAMGLVEKNKIELLGNLDWNIEDAKKISSEFPDNIKCIIKTNENTLVDKHGIINGYNYKILCEKIPQLIGARNIYDIISDPTYNITFMGLKFVSFEYIVTRSLLECSSSNFTDLLMYERSLDHDIGDRLCIPNMTIIKGKIRIYNKKRIERLIIKIKEKIEKEYEERITIEEIENRLKKCNDQAFDIYKGKHLYDQDMALIKKYHLDIKRSIFKKYCYKITNLLDIGSGQLTDSQFWTEQRIVNVIGIEPSKASIENGLKRLEKFGTTVNIKIINGVGNDKWNQLEKYSPIYKHKYDVITFQFTIHYMIYDIETVINNIVDVCKTGTLVIITCMDGNYIHREINKNGNIEIKNKNEIIFAIYPYSENYDSKSEEFPKESDVIVYFKGAYGVSNGSIEPLVNVNELTRLFNKYDFMLECKVGFLEYNSKIKYRMSNEQKSVSRHYITLIYKKR